MAGRVPDPAYLLGDEKLTVVSDADGTRGGAFYDNPDVLERYLAHRHSGLSSPNEVMEGPAFRKALGSVAGALVVDLGCGDGAFAAELIAAGCSSYLGVDGSSRMIAVAKAKHATQKVQFIVGDVEDFSPPKNCVDVVTARMVLHYVADIDTALARVAQCLGTSGRLVLSVVHPVITSNETAYPGPRTTWIVDRYFESGPRQRSWFGSTVTWYHRTIEQYITALQRAGFRLKSLSECEPSAQLLSELPGELERRRRVPLTLVIAATKI
jgi:ubiquinone/menaquinone biosynthesis C-methylase UbiE